MPKESAKPTITSFTGTGLVRVIDDSAGSPLSRNMSPANLATEMDAVLNADTSTAAMSFVIDEDNMASDSATKVPTQQSVKAYVDAASAGGTLSALTDTTITAAASGDILRHNGTAWVDTPGTDHYAPATFPDWVAINLGSPGTAIDTTGAIAGALWFPPWAITVTDVHLYVGSATTTGTLTLDINEAGTSILSTKLTIDATETSSATAATAAVISDASIAAHAKVSFDWDGVGDSTATDAIVVIEFTRDVS